MSAADRIEYEGYVTRRLAEFRDWAGVNTFVWDAAKLKAGQRRASARKRPLNDDGSERAASRLLIDTEDHDAFTGPWHTVRPYVTEEFRLWIDDYNEERLTFSEWKRAAVAERELERLRERDYLDSAEFCGHELEHWRELDAARDGLIAQMRERGATFRMICDATGMSRAAVHNVIIREQARAEADTTPDTVPTEWVEVNGVKEEVF